MKKAVTRSGNFAFKVSLFGGKLEAIAYVRPSGELLSVKDGDVYLFETWDHSHVAKDQKLEEEAETYLLIFWSQKINEGNVGTAVKVFDLGLMPEVENLIDFDDEVDLADFFYTLSRWGRNDVADSFV